MSGCLQYSLPVHLWRSWIIWLVEHLHEWVAFYHRANNAQLDSSPLLVGQRVASQFSVQGPGLWRWISAVGHDVGVVCNASSFLLLISWRITQAGSHLNNSFPKTSEFNSQNCISSSALSPGCRCRLWQAVLMASDSRRNQRSFWP